jgi:formamidopyrimidine-DNA glycosylase
MPELPEVEVTRRSFADRITGATIQGVRMGKPLRWPLQCEPAQLAGMRVRGVRRRGKYLLIDLSDGLLLVHLGMSGSVIFDRHLPPAGVHDHFDMVTDLGTLRLHDPRRFGAVVFAAGESDPVAQKLLGHLGVEPLDDGFDPAVFLAGLRQRKAPIKQVLLAGIRPTSPANSISKPRVAKLHAAVKDVLSRAVEKGGSTLRDFSNANGESGYFQLEANVYGREGAPCRVCATPVRAIRQGQRSTYYCMVCQKR